jgi:DNA-binding response OmpR family regulator
MKILLVDDNLALIESIKDHLGDSWQITATNNGYEGTKLAKSHKYDIIVLDLNLPDMSGQEVCRKLRKAGVTSPIIILSAIIEPDTKVSLFQAGADDYVTKPFDINEFRARLLALMRRGHLDSEEPHLLKIGGLVVDPNKRYVERDGKKIALRRKEFDILEYLIRNQGRVVTRAMIMDNVWEDSSESWNNTVDVHIKCLRDKVDRPFKRRLIQTAYGVGYTIKETV